MTAAVSASMRAALAKAQGAGGRLVRLPGGFWTFPGCALRPGSGYPVWSVAKGTVAALVKRGLAEPDEFAASNSRFMVGVKLTAAGVATCA